MNAKEIKHNCEKIILLLLLTFFFMYYSTFAPSIIEEGNISFTLGNSGSNLQNNQKKAHRLINCLNDDLQKSLSAYMNSKSISSLPFSLEIKKSGKNFWGVMKYKAKGLDNIKIMDDFLFRDLVEMRIRRLAPLEIINIRNKSDLHYFGGNASEFSFSWFTHFSRYMVFALLIMIFYYVRLIQVSLGNSPDSVNHASTDVSNTENNVK